MDTKYYTVITFAPVQGFIEKSRKLRDLYGSSYILSFLAWVICQAAYKLNCSVVSPALPNVTQGMPNQIILKGKLSEDDIKLIQAFFNKAWELLADSCQNWIESNILFYQNVGGNEQQWYYESWRRDWQLWKKYAWEFFLASGKSGESITQVRQRINQVKNSRDWTGINWQGESSTLSGADAIAYPYLGPKLDPSDPDYQKKRTAVCKVDPRTYNYQEERTTVRAFYQQLSQKLGESFIKATPDLKVLPEHVEELSKRYGSSFVDLREELSIPELIKRLITHKVIVDSLINKLHEFDINLASEQLKKIAEELNPKSFKDLNRLKDDESKEPKYWTAWFLGDGDGASKYFQSLPAAIEEEKTSEFSREMRRWGSMLREKEQQYLQGKGRMIYAGGDDFLGVLYKSKRQIPALECLKWFYTFKSEIWQKPQRKKISASVGFVWAGSQVPQRDVLQHCHLAESSAKSTGRDRIAFRILFNSGNYLEWVCPWWLLDDSDRLEFANENKLILPEPSEKLENLIESYQDRDKGNNWTHFYQDVAILESRHAFTKQSIDIALSLIEIYFNSTWKTIIGDTRNWWNHYDKNERQTFTGILGDPKRFNSEYKETLELKNELNKNPKVKNAFNNWVINLAKVGFYLTDDYGRTNQS